MSNVAAFNPCLHDYFLEISTPGITLAITVYMEYFFSVYRNDYKSLSGKTKINFLIFLYKSLS